ncbi:hypothetical protein HNR56_001708 [Roseospira marina]|nr:hypothetical protein [Roseospira marina]MBB5087015.1 hypothetical protein [Roseospira marina]
MTGRRPSKAHARWPPPLSTRGRQSADSPPTPDTHTVPPTAPPPASGRKTDRATRPPAAYAALAGPSAPSGATTAPRSPPGSRRPRFKALRAATPPSPPSRRIPVATATRPALRQDLKICVCPCSFPWPHHRSPLYSRERIPWSRHAEIRHDIGKGVPFPAHPVAGTPSSRKDEVNQQHVTVGHRIPGLPCVLWPTSGPPMISQAASPPFPRLAWKRRYHKSSTKDSRTYLPIKQAGYPRPNASKSLLFRP